MSQNHKEPKDERVLQVRDEKKLRKVRGCKDRDLQRRYSGEEGKDQFFQESVSTRQM